MTATTRVDADAGGPADPAMAERLHRLFSYLRAVRTVEVPVTDPGPYADRYRKWCELFATLNATSLP